MKRSDKWDLVRQSFSLLVAGGWIALAIFAFSEGLWIGWLILALSILVSVASVVTLCAQVEMIVSRVRLEEIENNLKDLSVIGRLFLGDES